MLNGEGGFAVLDVAAKGGEAAIGRGGPVSTSTGPRRPLQRRNVKRPLPPIRYPLSTPMAYLLPRIYGREEDVSRQEGQHIALDRVDPPPLPFNRSCEKARGWPTGQAAATVLERFRSCRLDGPEN